MKKGLVLCGGGSKGSYEMGAWKALYELGEAYEIVTGTSIGCLNAAMYAQHEYESCLELWNKIEVGMIMESGFNFDTSSIKQELKKKNDMLKFFGKYVTNMGSDIKPFINLMDEYIDEEKIKNSDITLGMCCAKFPSLKGVEVVANKDMAPGLIKKYILASASCFPVFPVCKIEKESYIDGGYYDNLPINFAIDLGATDITVIDLSENITHKEYLNKPFIRYIHPRRSLGSFMLFDQTVIQNNLTLGYNDTMKAFGKYIGLRYTFKPLNKKLEALAIDSKVFRPFILNISRLVGHIKRNKLKSKVLPEKAGDIFNILEELADGKPMTDAMYALRALEIAGEIVAMNDLKVYDFLEFFHKIIDTLFSYKDDSNLLDGYNILNVNKQKDFLYKLDDKKLLRYILNKAIGNFAIDTDFIINLALSKPRVFIAYFILKSINEIGDFTSEN